jgi:hypothetical protein
MTTILVSRCYSEITPESAEQGDFSDCGFVHEAEPFTFSELVWVIRRGGFSQDGCTDWLSTGYHVEDYRTCTEREETLHFDRANPERLRRWFWLAAKVANRHRS